MKLVFTSKKKRPKYKRFKDMAIGEEGILVDSRDGVVRSFRWHINPKAIYKKSDDVSLTSIVSEGLDWIGENYYPIIWVNNNPRVYPVDYKGPSHL